MSHKAYAFDWRAFQRDELPGLLRDEAGRLSSRGLAALIVDVLCDAGVVRKDDFDRAIEVTAEEIELRKALGDREEPVRETAAFAIADTCNGTGIAGQADLVTSLTRLLTEDKNPLVRRSAAVALGSLGATAKGSQAALEKALADGEVAVRQNAAWALGRLGRDVDPDAVEGLCGVLSDPDALVRRDAAGALGALGKTAAKAGVPQLIGLVAGEKDEVVRRTALDALAACALLAGGALLGLLSASWGKPAGPSRVVLLSPSRAAERPSLEWASALPARGLRPTTSAPRRSAASATAAGWSASSWLSTSSGRARTRRQICSEP